MKNKRTFSRVTGISSIVSLISLATFVALTALGSCSISVDKEMQNELDPPDHQLVLSYADVKYTADSTIVLPTSYTAIGDVQVLTMQNKLEAGNITITGISFDDEERFSTAEIALPLALAPLESQAIRLTFASETAGTFTGNLSIAYTAEGKNRTISVKIRAVRSLDDVPQISLFDDSNLQIDNNNTPAYNFGFSSAAIVKTFTIKNSGEKTLTINSVISNNSGDFAIITNPATTVEAGSSTTFRVSRTSGNVAATATITLISNAGNIPVFTFNVSSLDAEAGEIAVFGPTGLAVVRSNSIYNDLGYSTDATLSREFIIRNTGGANLTLNFVGSGDPAVEIVSAPDAGTVLAPDSTATFTLRISPSVESKAAITIVSDASNAKTFTFNVCGGGATLHLTATSAFVYRLSEEGYDFGYQASAAERTITLTNTGTTTIGLNAATTTNPVNRFSILSYGGSTIEPGATGSIQVRFTPNTSEWSEEFLILRDSNGRTWKLNLTGSGFRQPNDIEAPALWLRADRVRLENTEVVLGERIANAMPDVSGHGIETQAYSEDIYPPYVKYIENGINGRPSLEFYTTVPGTMTLKSYYIRAEPSSGNIIDQATSNGKTIAVVFKTYATPGGNSNRYILQPWYTPSSNSTFGQLYLEQSPTNYYRFRIGAYAYTTANSSGYEITSVYPQNYLSGGKSVQPNIVYSIVEAHDPSIARTTKNRFLWINGTSQALGEWPAVGQFRNLDTQKNYNGTDCLQHNNINFAAYQTANQTMHMIDVGRIYQISEVIVYPRRLTDPEVIALNAYFTGKFAMGAEP